MRRFTTKKTIRLIIIFLSIFVFIGGSIIIIPKLIIYGLMDAACSYSDNIDESKKNDLFLGLYKPMKDSIFLDSLLIPAQDIWFEKQWRTHHSLISKTRIRIEPGINIIAPYVDSPNLEIWSINGRDSYVFNNSHIPGYICFAEDSPDTLVLVFSIFQNHSIADTITYLKQ